MAGLKAALEAFESLELGEQINVPPPVPENPVGRKTVNAVKHNEVKSDRQPQIFSGFIT
tara:strand:+ start:636 stop:812 length:177 start_codon:yes stop_codon:yes gene_type:complete